MKPTGVGMLFFSLIGAAWYSMECGCDEPQPRSAFDSLVMDAGENAVDASLLGTSHPKTTSCGNKPPWLCRKMKNQVEGSLALTSPQPPEQLSETASAYTVGEWASDFPPGGGSGISTNPTTSLTASQMGHRSDRDTATLYSGFWPGVITSFTLVTMTEFGDRTFFIAALMAVKYRSDAVVLGAVSALCIQTFLSVGLGKLFHSFPLTITKQIGSLPIDDYLASILLFVFGLIHLRDAFAEEPERKEAICNYELDQAQNAVDHVQYLSLSIHPTFLAILRETFWAVFVAEVGDKSMMSTIALATAQNCYGVFYVSTLFAIIAGLLLQRYISNRIANAVGAVLFLIYSILTGIEGLSRQGVHFWGFFTQQAFTNAAALFPAAVLGLDLRDMFGFM